MLPFMYITPLSSERYLDRSATEELVERGGLRRPVAVIWMMPPQW